MCNSTYISCWHVLKLLWSSLECRLRRRCFGIGDLSRDLSEEKLALSNRKTSAISVSTSTTTKSSWPLDSTQHVSKSISIKKWQKFLIHWPLLSINRRPFFGLYLELPKSFPINYYVWVEQTKKVTISKFLKSFGTRISARFARICLLQIHFYCLFQKSDCPSQQNLKNVGF